MKRVSALLIVLLTAGFEWGPVRGALAADQRTETVWRGALRGDSLFLIATWVPAKGPSRCAASSGYDDEDSNLTAPKYLDYRIIDQQGRVRFSDHLSGDQGFGFCCDELEVEGVPWRDGIVIATLAGGWGCEPANDCAEQRYHYLVGRDSVAYSEWVTFDWNPAQMDTIHGLVDAGCIEYAMTLIPRLRGRAIDFEPVLRRGTKEGDLVKIEVEDVTWYCPREWPAKGPTRIELFRDPGAGASEALTIKHEDPIDVESVIVRAVKRPEGGYWPSLFRVGIRAQGRSGFATPAALKSVGLYLEEGIPPKPALH
jgi:hypothetical protein